MRPTPATLRCTAVLAVAALVAPAASCAHRQDTRPLIEWTDDDAAAIRMGAMAQGARAGGVDGAPRVDAGAVIVFRDVTVFPATAPDVVLEHHDVVVRGARIASVAPTGAALPEGAVVIEGRGRTLLPGLVDAHGHTQIAGSAPWYSVVADPEHTLQEYLYAGTTTVHDMGGRLDEALALKARVERGEIPGPRMRIAGPFFTAPGGYPESYISRIVAGPDSVKTRLLTPYLVRVDHPRDARRAVRALAAAGVDHIKLALASTPESAPLIDPIVLEAITDAAHDEGLQVMAHIDSAANARRAVDNGVDALVHGVHSTALSDEDARAIGAHRALVVPTLVTFERLWQLAYGKVAFTAIENETVAPNLRASLQERPADFVLDAELTAWLAHLDEHRDARLHANVTKLRDAGARILVGTDGHGSTGSFPAGIHEEMRMLVAAGLTPGEVLMGATSWSARISDPRPTYGTIQPGLDADLLLVEGDPLADIANTARIVEVVARGRRVHRLAP